MSENRDHGAEGDKNAGTEYTFAETLERRLFLTGKTLTLKNAEYSNGGDRYHNFRRAATIFNCTPERALLGMFAKHLVSVLDLVDLIDNCPPAFAGKKVEYVEEKIGDSINYLILLEGMLKHRLNQ